jgi:SnoaL-like domain
MHKNTGVVLEKFYKGVENHDHLAIAACYQSNGTFKDIAFELEGKKMIQAMWHMIAKTDLTISYEIKDTDENNGTALWTADYTFTDTGRKVHNELESNFRFSDGLILSQVDDCDPWNWGMQALGPAKGFLSWLVPAIRHKKAMDKLRNFIKDHPEYLEAQNLDSMRRSA